MVAVAQLVRAPDCGSGGRGFETHQPPKKKLIKLTSYAFYLIQKFLKRRNLNISHVKIPILQY